MADNKDHDPKTGRWLKGCKGGPGNPDLKRRHQLRIALKKAVTAQDMEEVFKVFVAKGKKGDLAAAKFVVEYTYGKPQQYIELTSDEPLFNLNDRLHSAIVGVYGEQRVEEPETSEGVGTGSNGHVPTQHPPEVSDTTTDSTR